MSPTFAGDNRARRRRILSIYTGLGPVPVGRVDGDVPGERNRVEKRRERRSRDLAGRETGGQIRQIDCTDQCAQLLGAWEFARGGRAASNTGGEGLDFKRFIALQAPIGYRFDLSFVTSPVSPCRGGPRVSASFAPRRTVCYQ